MPVARLPDQLPASYPTGCWLATSPLAPLVPPLAHPWLPPPPPRREHLQRYWEWAAAVPEAQADIALATQRAIQAKPRVGSSFRWVLGRPPFFWGGGRRGARAARGVGAGGGGERCFSKRAWQQQQQQQFRAPYRACVVLVGA